MGYLHLAENMSSVLVHYVLSGSLPVLLALSLDKLGICRLPAIDKDAANPWKDGDNSDRK